MDWYYASDNQQCGPVTEAQLNELLLSGTITLDTLVWRSGLTEWRPLRAMRPSESPPLPTSLAMPSAAAGTAVCAECRQLFPETEMVRLNQSWVCAGCKPIFLQRLAEGAAPTAVGAVWRSARQIVMRPETPLPDACVRCNASANGYRLKRTLYWHSPYFYLLILVSILIYLIVALCVRKKAVIHIGLCEKHQAQRRWFVAGAWLGVLAGITMVIVGINASASAGLILGGVVLFVIAAIVGAVKGAVVSAAKIDKEVVWVKGAGHEFLGNLPDWPGPR